MKLSSITCLKLCCICNSYSVASSLKASGVAFHISNFKQKLVVELFSTCTIFKTTTDEVLVTFIKTSYKTILAFLLSFSTYKNSQH